MSTAVIIAIVVVVVVAIALIALPRMRAKSRERELTRRRGEVADGCPKWMTRVDAPSPVPAAREHDNFALW